MNECKIVCCSLLKEGMIVLRVVMFNWSWLFTSFLYIPDSLCLESVCCAAVDNLSCYFHNYTWTLLHDTPSPLTTYLLSPLSAIPHDRPIECSFWQWTSQNSFHRESTLGLIFSFNFIAVGFLNDWGKSFI